MTAPPISSCLFLDTETTGLNPFTPSTKCRGIGWLDGATGEQSYVSLDYWDGDMDLLAPLQSLLLSRNIIAHNLHYDLQILYKVGLELPGNTNWHCTLMLTKLAAPRLLDYGLKKLAVRLFSESDDDEDKALKDWCKKQKPRVSVEDRFIKAPQELLSIYCLKDVYLCAKLWARFSSHLSRPEILAEYSEEMEVLAAIVEAERQGMRLDLPTLTQVRADLKVAIEGQKEACYALHGSRFNVNSGKQLALALYGDGVPARFTKGGGAATDKATLRSLAGDSALAAAVLKVRHTKRLLEYLDEYEELRRSDIISGTFHTVGAKTGRFSCSDPNLQNIPRPDEKGATILRALFIPREGRVIVAADFSQIELRVGAFYAGCRRMLDILNSGGDLHEETARMIQHSRQIAKSANFLLIYLGTADKLRDYLALFGTMISLRAARDICEAFHVGYPEFRQLGRKVEREVARDGGVTDLLGRFYPVPRAQAYQGVNRLVQGTCARILKGAIRRLLPICQEFGAGMISFIHDEILFDAPVAACQLSPVEGSKDWAAPESGFLGQVRAAMEQPLTAAISVATPVEVSVCPVNWARKQKVKVWT